MRLVLRGRIRRTLCVVTHTFLIFRIERPAWFEVKPASERQTKSPTWPLQTLRLYTKASRRTLRLVRLT